MIKFICGLFLSGIMPAILIRQLRKGAVFSGTIENQRKILYNISIISISIICTLNQNHEILMGTLIGSALFQLLGICGVNKLNTVGKQKEGLIVYKGQYMIFCAILLLFLSADYLLRGKSIENILNQIDGGILIFLFLIYFYFTYVRGERSARLFRKIPTVWNHINKKYAKRKKLIETNEKNRIRKKMTTKIFAYIVIIAAIIIGNVFLFEGVSKLGIELDISQYCVGLTLMAWSDNLLGILLGNMSDFSEDNSSEEDSLEIELENGEALIEEAIEKEEHNMENIIEGIIFSMTLLLGIIAIRKPIMIHIYTIYDLIIFGIISILIQFISKIDNRLAGSGMATAYIGFIIYALMR